MFNVKESVCQNFPSLVEKFPSSITNLVIKTLQSILKEKQFQELNNKTAHLRGSDFADGALAHLNITHTLCPNELKNIPATGKLIIIANHITGAPDSFSLVQLVASVRKDKKVRMVVNGMVMGMKQASDIMIPVDTISGKITKQSIQAINESLDNDEAIIIFPAGYVNRLSFKGLRDIPWKSSFFKIAKRQSCPIIPIRIKGRNSFLFYFLSTILPTKLSAMLLPREFINFSQQTPLHFHIGKVIPSSSYADTQFNAKEYVELFYKHLYTLGTKRKEVLKTEVSIAAAENKMMLNKEVKEAEFLGKTFDGKEIIIAEPSKSSFLLRELGRSREISFRAIGGGTGQARDNDAYDNYYRHLILWDAKELEIVGAYRIGECCKIIKEKGVQGLYTNNLYSYDEDFKEYCSQSIELGRSFVQPRYWGTRALDYLFQGIFTYLEHHQQVRYTYGTVTINADTPQDASAALVYFYSYYFACPGNLITAKNPYIMSDEHQKLFDGMFKDLTYKEGLVVLKKYLKDLDTIIPTLFKQYAEFYEEGAVFFANFSVNDGLLGVIEGFIITDNSRMKESRKKRYLKMFEGREVA